MRRLHVRAARLAAALLVIGLISPAVRADGLYSVTDLGAASPTANVTGQSQPNAVSGIPFLGGSNLVNSNGNYLAALSTSQQAAFQAGSFDLYAHASSSPYAYSNTPFFQSYAGYDVAAPSSYIGGYTSLSQITLATSNNLGVSAGTATEHLFQAEGPHLIVFTPDPHTVSYHDPNIGQQTVQSPGYVSPEFTASDGRYDQFFGIPAGINDHNNIALTESTYPGSQAVLNPHLLIGGTDVALGSLGGANGAAYALNNSNEVVGWSQIASGAVHAFLYANGTMQDLNSLIPSSSGIVLTSAVGIDAAGDIVAYGTDSSGVSHEYLLTSTEAPVPEPSSLAVMGLMIAAVAVRQACFRFKKAPRSQRRA